MEDNFTYIAAPERYGAGLNYRRAGRSGILLPELSLGLWHNFGTADAPAESRHKLLYAFDRGITHFDLANNYGPPPGSAEEAFGRVMKHDLAPYRDELFISTKAGHDMWPGPYGTWGSRKSLMASLDQSLRRMNLDYVDIFYSHRYDPDTPLEETMQTLVDIVRQGKALYVGLSKYPLHEAERAYAYLRDHDTPCLLYQGRYNLLDRAVEEQGLVEQAAEAGAGFVAFSPLAQGLLSGRYLDGIPADSRVARGGFLKAGSLTPEVMAKVRALDAVARRRGQTLAQMALAWLLRDRRVTSVIVGVSSVTQLDDNLAALRCTDFTDDELATIADIVGK